jgi:hypothetical protein
MLTLTTLFSVFNRSTLSAELTAPCVVYLELLGLKTVRLHLAALPLHTSPVLQLW